MPKRGRKSQQQDLPRLKREWSIFSRDEDDDVHGSRIGERAGRHAPTGGGARKDRSAAPPDNPNLIALGARNKLAQHDQNRDQKSQQHRRIQPRQQRYTPLGDDKASEEQDHTPKETLYPRPYGPLTPPSEDEFTNTMAPAPAPLTAPNGQPGPHPSFIEVAKPYIFQQNVDQFLTAIGMPEAKEDSIRLQGVQLIDNVRKSLQLYIFPHPSFSRPL